MPAAIAVSLIFFGMCVVALALSFLPFGEDD